MWLARYIMSRIGESFGVTMNWTCKPIKGDWNGSGCHTNFSTNLTRAEGGLNYIREHCMKKLSEKHQDHLFLYGVGND
jgi:glutamine synthetase